MNTERYGLTGKIVKVTTKKVAKTVVNELTDKSVIDVIHRAKDTYGIVLLDDRVTGRVALLLHGMADVWVCNSNTVELVEVEREDSNTYKILVAIMMRYQKFLPLVLEVEEYKKKIREGTTGVSILESVKVLEKLRADLYAKYSDFMDRVGHTYPNRLSTHLLNNYISMVNESVEDSEQGVSTGFSLRKVDEWKKVEHSVYFNKFMSTIRLKSRGSQKYALFNQALTDEDRRQYGSYLEKIVYKKFGWGQDDVKFDYEYSVFDPKEIATIRIIIDNTKGFFSWEQARDFIQFVNSFEFNFADYYDVLEHEGGDIH